MKKQTSSFSLSPENVAYIDDQWKGKGKRNRSHWLDDLITHLREKQSPSKKPEVKKIELEYPIELNLDAWSEWKKYRKEMKMKAYKPTPRSEGAAVKKLIEMSEGNHDVQALIIKQSMENSWQGLFELRGTYATNQSTANATSNRKLSAAEENENRLRQLYGNNRMEGNEPSGYRVHPSGNDGYIQQPLEAHEASIELGANDWRVID